MFQEHNLPSNFSLHRAQLFETHFINDRYTRNIFAGVGFAMIFIVASVASVLALAIVLCIIERRFVPCLLCNMFGDVSKLKQEYDYDCVVDYIPMDMIANDQVLNFADQYLDMTLGDKEVEFNVKDTQLELIAFTGETYKKEFILFKYRPTPIQMLSQNRLTILFLIIISILTIGAISCFIAFAVIEQTARRDLNFEQRQTFFAFIAALMLPFFAIPVFMFKTGVDMAYESLSTIYLISDKRVMELKESPAGYKISWVPFTDMMQLEDTDFEPVSTTLYSTKLCGVRRETWLCCCCNLLFPPLLQGSFLSDGVITANLTVRDSNDRTTTLAWIPSADLIWKLIRVLRTTAKEIAAVEEAIPANTDVELVSIEIEDKKHQPAKEQPTMYERENDTMTHDVSQLHEQIEEYYIPIAQPEVIEGAIAPTTPSTINNVDITSANNNTFDATILRGDNDTPLVFEVPRIREIYILETEEIFDLAKQ